MNTWIEHAKRSLLAATLLAGCTTDALDPGADDGGSDDGSLDGGADESSGGPECNAEGAEDPACDPAQPMCVDQTCQSCAAHDDDWCESLDPNRPICDPSGACVPCGEDATCPADTPVCGDEGQCTQCSVEDVSMCDAANPICGDDGACTNLCETGGFGVWTGIRYYPSEFDDEIYEEGLTWHLTPPDPEGDCANSSIESSDGFCGRFNEHGLFLRMGGGHSQQTWEGDTDPANGCTTVVGGYSTYGFYADFELTYEGPLPPPEE